MRPWGAEWLRLCGAYYYSVAEPLIFFLTFLENVYRAGAVAPPDELIVDLGNHPAATAFACHAADVLKVSCRVEVHGHSPHPFIAALTLLARHTARLVYYGLAGVMGRRPAPE